MTPASLSWFAIARLGLVQTALGSVVVLTTSTLNRVMVVELALPAMLPGFLVGLHYAMQVFRPRLGFGSDAGGRRTPWILGGMLVLAFGGTLAAVATAWMTTDVVFGIALAIVAFVMIGLGVGAAGTSLLVLLATRTDQGRRAAAASMAWIMMIAGFIATTVLAGAMLDPFSPARLVAVSATISIIAMMLTLMGVWGIEGAAITQAGERRADAGFAQALRDVWQEPGARRFALFVFVSMLAYSAQDLILEPFAGAVFGLTPGETTKLSGLQHSGALAGMVLVPLAGALHPALRQHTLRWIVGGCIASALALLSLAGAAASGPGFPLRGAVFLLGLTNGVYAIAAIGTMMNLVGAGRRGREGTRMGLWGAAQAIAFGLGGFAGTVASDAASRVMPSLSSAYATVFCAEAMLFVVAAGLAITMMRPTPTLAAAETHGGPRPATAGV